MYKIKEIFNSIQGEGFNTGKKSVFVRFSGCNLWNGNFETKKNSICNFCDTDFKGTNGKNGGKYKLEDLIKKVVKVVSAVKLIAISGPVLVKPFLEMTGPENVVFAIIISS